MKDDEIKQSVRESYTKVAVESRSCCVPTESCGCGPSAVDQSAAIGYSAEEMAEVPGGANLGLGCGNPTAIASLVEGETVLDLGSGAGFDCFIAANRVSESGSVIGVDMTPEMIHKARANAAKGDYKNVDFRLGELEHLPMADAEADVVISNCVINLVPNKEQVFREAFRALKPGGRMIVSDMVLLEAWPDGMEKTVAAYSACLAGAALKDDYLAAIEAAGFEDIRVAKQTSAAGMFEGAIETGVADTLGLSKEEAMAAAAKAASLEVLAVKPRD